MTHVQPCACSRCSREQGPVTTKQAAAIKGKSVRRIQELITSGDLPARRMGRDWMICPAELELLKIRPVGRPRRIG